MAINLLRTLVSGLWTTALPAAALALTLCTSACSGDGKAAADSENVLVQIGDSVLTADRVLARIPPGLQPEDSTRFFKLIVDTWIQDRLLSSVAEDNIVDIKKIDKMTAEYRNRLIINEYMHLMQQNKSSLVSEDEVKRYYEENSSKMLLEQPLVKGIYIKVPDNAERLQDIRRWMKNSSPQSIDKLEKYGLNGAMRYDYFVDTWIDWQTLTAEIPYHFGDPDAFIAAHRDFETASSGAIYLLHISQSLKSGEVMPYDFAAPIIRESLLQGSREKYGDMLMRSLCDQARKEGRLQTPNYDISTGKMINNHKSQPK